MHGEPAWAPNFTHPSYANPAAPKGGTLVQGVLGTFDSLNPFIVKGLPAVNIRSYVIESLLARGYDEPFTLYGLLADSVETDAARSFVTFTINPAARFSDGKPVTPEDVIFSWQLLRDHGRPNFRIYYSKVAKADVVGEHGVRFDLAGSDDRELPLILGLMPVLAKHATNPDTFEETSFAAPLGSGPYTRHRGEAGRPRHLHAQPELLGPRPADQPRLCGISTPSASTITATATRISRRSRTASTTYARKPIPAAGRPPIIFRRCVRAGWSRRNSPTGCPRACSGLVFNTRRPIFADMRVREAMLHLFDFEWINHTYFFDLYQRTASYFDDCDLSAHGQPANARERALLKPFPGAVRADIMEGTMVAAQDRRLRPRPRRPAPRLRTVQAGRLRAQRHAARPPARAGGRFAFEILTTDARPGAAGARLSRTASSAPASTRCVRNVDATQFEHRLLSFDFDMTEYHWEQSLSPGNEQLFYWSSEAADQQGSRNYMGVKSKAIDAMIAALLAATATRGFRRRRARARPRAVVGLLRRPALLSAGAMDRALDANQASDTHLAVRLSAGNLVAPGRPLMRRAP